MTERDQLAIIRGWFEGMGAKVSDVPADITAGRDRPSLSIDLGGRFLGNAVEDNGKAIILIFTMSPAPEVAAAAKALSRENQEKVFLLLRNALLDNPRLAWALQPPNVTAIGEITGIQMTQRFRVSEDDPSTFNRFTDAWQELVTAQVRIQVLYETTVGARPPVKGDERRHRDRDVSGAYR